MNVTRFGDRSRCWSAPGIHKTYIVFVAPHAHSSNGSSNARLAARYDDPFGAVVDFTEDVERSILKAVGKCSLPVWP